MNGCYTCLYVYIHLPIYSLFDAAGTRRERNSGFGEICHCLPRLRNASPRRRGGGNKRPERVRQLYGQLLRRRSEIFIDETRCRRRCCLRNAQLASTMAVESLSLSVGLSPSTSSLALFSSQSASSPWLCSSSTRASVPFPSSRAAGFFALSSCSVYTHTCTYVTRIYGRNRYFLLRTARAVRLSFCRSESRVVLAPLLFTTRRRVLSYEGEAIAS